MVRVRAPADPSCYGTVPQQDSNDDRAHEAEEEQLDEGLGIAGADYSFPPSSSPASARTGTSSALSPMTFLSFADSTFTPLSMTSSDLYIGSIDEDDEDDEPEHQQQRKSLISKGAEQRHSHQSSSSASAGRWLASRKSLAMAAGLAKGGGRGGGSEGEGEEDAVPATVSGGDMAQSLPPSSRATDVTRHGNGYGLLLSNSPALHHSTSPDALVADNGGSTSGSSMSSPSLPSPALAPAASAVGADSAADSPDDLAKRGDGEEDSTAFEAAILNPDRDIIANPRQRHSAHSRSPTHAAEASTQSNQNNQNTTRDTTTQALASPNPSSISAPGIIRPKFGRRPLSLPVDNAESSAIASASALSADTESDRQASARVVRSNSVLRHPVPDLNTRSGAYTTNIAALEATAERFSLTSSIEDAIRDAHDELKRTDSRRSAILIAANVQNPSVNGDGSVVDGQLAPALARQSSIVEVNNSARLGGYSPAGYVMSPTNSLSSRLRSSSRGVPLSRQNSTRSRRSNEIEGDAFPFLSRHGPGKGSVHSVHSIHSTRSAALSLAEIAEMEPPTSLTLAAMDEADRTATHGGDDTEDEDTIRASAYQHVEPGATDVEVDGDNDVTPNAEDWAKRPMLDHTAESYWNDTESPRLQLQLTNPSEDMGLEHEFHTVFEQQRPASPGSDGRYGQTENAFEDFDGVHCDPDSVAEQFPVNPEETTMPPPPPPPPTQRQSRVPQLPKERPKSFFDPATGQQMLYYPARVPAMLNLPPKLGRGQKPATMEKRRTQILSMMAQDNTEPRESKIWLPDPLEGHNRESLFMDDPRPGSSSRPESVRAGQAPEHLAHVGLPAAEPILSEDNEAPAELQHLRRPAKLTDADRRKSRASMMPTELPPQLRASAFFDLPSAAPRIEVKDGSAMATLDSILDAAAGAPVNAFTDHAIAGHLGDEVYGREKKGKKKDRQSKLGADMSHATVRASNVPALGVPEVDKRKSGWSLLNRRRTSDMAVVSGGLDEERQSLSGAANGDPLSPLSAQEAAALAPDEDEESSSEEEPEQDEVYNGAPTTLLAELQLRKQQQKMRTRPVHRAFPNGLHSTLLELDTVAQVEARTRRGKRVNLAWEDPDMNADLQEEEDDEDVPLGMLALRKQAGNADISAVAAEANRPIGLMERREIEDNEPLSRRRDRLQGKEVPVSMYLNPANTSKHQSMLTLNPGMTPITSSGSAGQPSPQIPSQDEEPQVEEIEGETLGERMRRLRAKEEAENPLPRTRPVSRAFSAELLSVFGGDDGDDAKRKSDGSGDPKGKGRGSAPEEEETLGQRRRRLQAEREAREREMAAGGGAPSTNMAALNALNGVAGPEQRLSRRVSLADVLSANPFGSAMGAVDPREVEQRRVEQEAARAARENEEKMRLFRSQIPTSLKDPRSGIPQSGGFVGGGMGGRPGIRTVSSMGTLPGQQAMNGMNGIRPQMGVPYGYGYNNAGMQPQGSHPGMPMGMGMGMNGAYGAAPQYAGAYGAMNAGAYAGGYGMPMPYQMQMPNTQGQVDMVERWRQSVMP